MIKKSLLLMLLVAVLGGCTSPSKEQTAVTGIDVLTAWENLSGLECSRLGQNIRYVPLETNDSSLIGNNYNIHLLKNHILVETDNRALLFDRRTGKYLRQIGHRGDDPKGYLDNVCHVHRHSEDLYFPRHDKLVGYNLQGEYLGTVSFPAGTSFESCYPLLTDTTVWAYQGGSVGSSGNTLIYSSSRDGIKTDSIVLPGTLEPFDAADIASISVFKGNSAMKFTGLMGYNGLILIEWKDDRKSLIAPHYPALWQQGEEVCFREAFSDTVFSVERNVLEPRCVFETGDRHFPVERKGQKEGTARYLTVTYVMETPQLIYFQCAKDLYNKAELFNGVYRKEDNAVWMSRASEGFTDDLTFFLPFHPEACDKQGAFASLVQVGDIQEWQEEYGTAGLPDESLKHLKDDDNPVCVIVYP